ncbi:MAG: hypothetical protein IJF92_05135 [Bacilli bacterium]|nr:hypothetical protein [Bacilli bacterium]
MSDKDNNDIDLSFVKIVNERNAENRKRALEKSRIDRKNLKIKNSRKKTLKKRILITAIIVLVAAGSGVKYIPEAIDHHQQQEVETAFEGIYGDSLRDIVSRAGNPKNGDFDYVEIADEIRDMAKSENELDNIIYELYNDYGKLVGYPAYTGITDRTIQYIPKDEKNLEFYEGLDDYIHTKGFKNLDEYDSAMRNKVLDEYNKEEKVSKGVR